MNKANTLVVAVLLGAAAALGTAAALRTAHVGASSAKAKPTASASRVIARRSAALDRIEASLRHALAKRPPELPKVPHFAPVSTPPAQAPVAAPAPAAAPAPQIRYYRPPPIIIHKHRAGGEHDGEGDHGDGGGGGD